MRNSQESSDSRTARLLLWAQRLLMIAGTTMLAWSAALVVDARIAQRNARSTFETALLTRTVAVPSHLDDMTVIGHAPPLRAVDRGSPIAALSIPRIHLSAMVLHGSDAQTLRRGPGHLENTAFPGEPGNVVIAGHRDSFFWSLQNIHVGDDIFLDTSEGPLQYRVTSARVVTPGEVSVLAPTDEPVLTLITCYPFSVLGPAPDRFVVRAMRVDWPSSTPVEARTQGPLEPARAAAPDTVGINEPVSVGRVSDAQTLVQEAVASYLRILGARLVTRTDVRSGGSPGFTCDITFSDDRASADCNAVAPSSEQEPKGRIFTLERSDVAWAIRSVVLK